MRRRRDRSRDSALRLELVSGRLGLESRALEQLTLIRSLVAGREAVELTLADGAAERMGSSSPWLLSVLCVELRPYDFSGHPTSASDTPRAVDRLQPLLRVVTQGTLLLEPLLLAPVPEAGADSRDPSPQASSFAMLARRSPLRTPCAVRSFASTPTPQWGTPRPSLSRLPIDISPEVLSAQAEGRAIVALESTLITHGPSPPPPCEHAR